MREISLNASMRSNLLSLQQTQMLQDMTQLRLSTGLKVNSAIDNPSSYYTASSLNNRAKDLSQLLDAMGQGIQTIKTASETLMTATKFLEQAKAVANKALETLPPTIAVVRNETELLKAINSGERGTIVVNGRINLSGNQKLVLKDGQSLVGADYYDKSVPKATLSFDIKGTNGANFNARCLSLGNNSTLSNLNILINSDSNGTWGVVADNVKATQVKDVNIDYKNTGTALVSNNLIRSTNNAEMTISGEYNSTGSGGLLRALIASNGGYIKVAEKAKINTFLDGNSTHRAIEAYQSATIDIMSEAKINLYVKTHTNNSSGISIGEGSKLNINNAEINILCDNLSSNTGTQGLTITAGISPSSINILGASKININCLGAGSQAVGVVNGDLNLGKDVVMNLSTNHATSTAISLLKYGATISTLSAEKGVKISINDAANGTNNGYWVANKDWFMTRRDGAANIDFINLNGLIDFDNLVDPVPSAFAGITIDFDKVIWLQYRGEKVSSQPYLNLLSQYNQLIQDGGYKGVNLLDNQNLKINFNEERSSQINIAGVDASVKNLGINNRSWESQADVKKSLEELGNAINQIRTFSSQFGNYYSIVSSRQDFTENLINVLTEGSDKLTLADMNEESANMLALRTRQQLAINSLSLASQASKSVLNLF